MNPADPTFQSSSTHNHTQAIANAMKASVNIIRVEPSEFLKVLKKNPEPLLVHSTGGFFSTVHKHLTSYRGMIFYAESESPLPEVPNCEIVEAKTIWIPG